MKMFFLYSFPFDLRVRVYKTHVAKFGQRVVLLLIGQVAQHCHNQSNTKGHARGPCDRQGFFVQPGGTNKISLHPRQFRKIAQGKASKVWKACEPGPPMARASPLAGQMGS